MLDDVNLINAEVLMKWLNVFSDRSDPLVNLNFAVFLYNQGDMTDALLQYQDMERKVNAQVENNSNVEFDPEVPTTRASE